MVDFMIYLYAMVSLVLLLGGCKKPTDSNSAEKFARLINLDNERLKHLIKHVHDEKWQIVYGFYGKEKTCSSPVLLKGKDLLPDEKKKRDVITLQMENNIADALDTWLSPLRKLGLQKRIITKKDFEFKELAPIPISWEGGGVFINSYTAEHLEKNNLLSTTDLTIAFGCGNREHFAGGAWFASTRDFFSEPHLIPPNIYLAETSIPPKSKQHKNKQHLILLHEIGHAFGLADTYDVFGQSMAIMSTASDLISDITSLESDDIKGIEWLYYYYHDPEKNCGESMLLC